MKKINNVLDTTVKILKVLYYCFLIGLIFVLINSYSSFDFAEVNEALETAVELTHCEIEYKDFHYKGYCVDIEETYNFLNNQYNVSLIN